MPQQKPIYNILFSKVKLNCDLSDQNLALPSFLKEEGPERKNIHRFLSMGVYDYIYIYPVKPMEEESLLQAVERETKKITLAQLEAGSAPADADESMFHFFHPCFVMPDDGGEDRIEAFFRCVDDDDPCCFFYITSVYFNHNDVDSDAQREMRETLERQLNTAAGEEYQYLICRSLELSNFVILWRSREIAPVLEALHSFYEKPSKIGFTETVCCLPVEWFADMLPERKLTDTRIGNHLAHAKKVNMVNMRIFAKSYPALLHMRDQLVKQLKEADISKIDENSGYFFVLGADDLLCVFRDVEPSVIYMFYNLFYKLLREPRLKDALDSICTQIGIEDLIEGPALKDLKPVRPTALAECCMALRARYSVLFSSHWEVFQSQKWLEHLVGSLQWLVNLSNSYVFDNVCFILLRSLHFFYQWLEEAVSGSGDAGMFFTRRSYEIDMYLSGLQDLADHIVRAEGNAAQSADFKFPRYNMCTGVLEFCGSYFQEIYNFLVELEDPEKRKVAWGRQSPHVLIPARCRRIKTIPLFRGGHNKPFMFYLEVPIESIGNPFQILAVLVHEASHFLGSFLRNRPERFHALVECLAIAYADNLGIHSVGWIIWFAEDMKSEILLRMQHASSQPQSTMYLHETVEIAKKVFRLIYGFQRGKQADMTAAYMRAVSDDSPEMECMFRALLETSSHALTNKVYGASFDSMVQDAESIFRESLADLMMLFVLRLDMRQYLQVLSADFQQLNAVTDYRSRLSMLLQRIIVVRSAFQENGMMGPQTDTELARQYQMPLEAFPRELNRLLSEIPADDVFCGERYRDTIAETKRGLQDYNEKHGEYHAREERDPLSALNEMFYPFEFLDIVVHYLRSCLFQLVNKINASKSLQKKLDLLKERFDSYAVENNLFTDDFFKLLSDSRKALIDSVNH